MTILYEWGLTVPWQITRVALDAMLTIALREPIESADLAQALHGPHSLSLRDGKPRSDRAGIVMHGPVAVIAIDGPIYRYADFFTSYSGGITTEALAKDFQAALDDPGVRAIAFVIDSPGGEATGIGELADTISASRDVKPMAAYIEGLGASAAYRIAAATGQVVIDADGWAGSIGTVMGVPDPSKRSNRAIEFVSSQSPKKRADPTTPEGKAYYQQLIDDMTENFIGQIVRDRNISRESVLSIGGGMLVGQQAVAAGLADRTGSEEQLIRSLIAQAQGGMPLFMKRPMPLPVRPGMTQAKEIQMKLSELFSGFLRAAKQEGIEIEPDEIAQADAAAQTNPPAQAATPDPALAARLADLEKQLADQRETEAKARAAAFADGAVRNNRALPAERESLFAAYLQAAKDDTSDGGTRAAMLDQLIAARPAHDLSSEQVITNAAGPLDSSTPTAPKPERINALLAMTPAGQAVLELRRRARGA